MPKAMEAMPEPDASVLLWLWDLLAEVVELKEFNKMDSQSLSQSFGPIMTSLTERHLKKSRLTMMAMFASRVVMFTQRGIEWRLSLRSSTSS